MFVVDWKDNNSPQSFCTHSYELAFEKYCSLYNEDGVTDLQIRDLDREESFVDPKWEKELKTDWRGEH